MAKEVIDRIRHKILFKQADTDNDFVSGTAHPMGLKCRFYGLDNGDLATSFTLDKWCEGHRGYGHGGICYAVIDEVMGRAKSAYDYINRDFYTPVMTGEITCRYISPAPIGEKLYAYGRVTSAEGRKYFTSGEILREDGTVVIRATGVYLSVDFIKPSDGADVSMPLEDGDPREM